MAFVCAVYSGVLFLVGLAVGSFLNVVAYRVPRGMSILRPPSACPRCGAGIRARDNIPIVGYLLLGGKCRQCGRRISPRYPLVELATGLLWAATGWKMALLEPGSWTNVAVGLVWLAFVSAAVVTFLVDLDHLIVLDEISLGGAALALCLSPFLPVLHRAHDRAAFFESNPLVALLLPDGPPWLWSAASSVSGAVVGFGFSLLILWMGNAAFRKQIAEARKTDPDIQSALGWGDVKLMAFYGAVQGWVAVFFIFLVASVLGAAAGCAVKLWSGDPGGQTGWKGVRARWRSSGSVLPFAPFLAVASLLLFFGNRLV